MESTDTGQKPSKRAGKKEVSRATIQCRKFAGSDIIFLMLEYLLDSLYSDSVIDPISYQLHPGSDFSAIYVNGRGPLLIEQGQTGGECKVSAIVALRKHRAEKSSQIVITEPQVPPSCS